MTHIALVGFTTVIFGVASLLLISRARNRLSEGSIRKYMDNFAICLAFIVIFSVWQTVRNFAGVGIDVTEHATYLTYPEYLFIVFAYIAFIFASFRVLKISEEFGFKEDGRRIHQIIKENPIEKPVTLPKAKKSKKR